MILTPGERVVWFRTNGRAKWRRVDAVYLGPSAQGTRHKIAFLDEATGIVKTRSVDPDMVERPKQGETK